MRRIINFLGVILVVGLAVALIPSSNALAGKAKKASTTGSACGGTSSDGSDNNPSCDCMPLSTFVAAGDGTAVDDLFSDPTTGNYLGCYFPGSGDPLAPNDNPEMACPIPATGSLVNLSCGCVLAGGENPSPGANVLLTGDSQHGNWNLTQLEVSFAFGDNNGTTETDFFIGNPNGTGAGTNGGRCYGASGFATLVSVGTLSGSMQKNETAYLELQGTICDTIPFTDPVEPQKGSFTGSFVLDPSRSSNYFINYKSTGTFVITIDDVSAAPAAYSDAQFSFSGFMTP